MKLKKSFNFTTFPFLTPPHDWAPMTPDEIALAVATCYAVMTVTLHNCEL
jgi:hypothetical protein